MGCGRNCVEQFGCPRRTHGLHVLDGWIEMARLWQHNRISLAEMSGVDYRAVSRILLAEHEIAQRRKELAEQIAKIKGRRT
jgi:hypothetical protein